MFHLFLQIKWTKKIEFRYFICFIYLRENAIKCRGLHTGRFWDFASANCRQVADDFCPTRELTQTPHFFPFSRKLFFIHPSYFTLEILQVHSDKVHNELFWRFSIRLQCYVLSHKNNHFSNVVNAFLYCFDCAPCCFLMVFSSSTLCFSHI